MEIVKRGFVPTDSRDFNEKNIAVMRKAQADIFYLVNHDYPIKNAVTFVGNRYQLSERQRTALQRAVSSEKSISERNKKLVSTGYTANIDGLNIIITLETALSGTTLLKCMDGTVRDLAGLRGTYKLIDKTDTAIRLIAEKLTEKGFKKAVFYIDKPVSNTGRLKQRILEIMADYPVDVSAELVDNADVVLWEKDCVISSDAIILDKCISWVNFANEICRDIETANPYDFSEVKYE